MRYRIVITELRPNPAFDPTRPQQGQMYTMELETNALTFVATDTQFNAIRKAALEAM